ncbi:PepSY domain-containing protein [Phenylobacterium sp. J367]|uniref:PepSY domain-containing protein n=1 Tax=Phenylobacterium sp. J367 TaxID=2898435 RepID=UPI002151B8C8|nr:hypothetical protein [Phenylobacterium sp. J367]MCR5878864.1 hypothetical protein [Phenylobacterium sp. J367]
MKRLLVIAALLGAFAAPVAAEAQAARIVPVQNGRLVPLPRVLETIGQQMPGRHLNTTMGDAGGRPAYFVQWQTPDGRVMVIVVDAQTGRIVGRQ